MVDRASHFWYGTAISQVAISTIPSIPRTTTRLFRCRTLPRAHTLIAHTPFHSLPMRQLDCPQIRRRIGIVGSHGSMPNIHGICKNDNWYGGDHSRDQCGIERRREVALSRLPCNIPIIHCWTLVCTASPTDITNEHNNNDNTVWTVATTTTTTITTATTTTTNRNNQRNNCSQTRTATPPPRQHRNRRTTGPTTTKTTTTKPMNGTTTRTRATAARRQMRMRIRQIPATVLTQRPRRPHCHRRHFLRNMRGRHRPSNHPSRWKILPLTGPSLIQMATRGVPALGDCCVKTRSFLKSNHTTLIRSIGR